MAYKKGMNPYKILGVTTIIYITTKENITYEVLIDTEDLQKLIDLDSSWTIKYCKSSRDIYARTTIYLGKINNKYKYETIYLHLFICKINSINKMCVDHENHNTLDNRKQNLRISEYNENLKHRKGKNKNNSSGFRNVCWDSRKEKWIVQLQIDGKNKVLGEFAYEALDKAGELAERMREKYYGEFKGNN